MADKGIPRRALFGDRHVRRSCPGPFRHFEMGGYTRKSRMGDCPFYLWRGYFPRPGNGLLRGCQLFCLPLFSACSRGRMVASVCWRRGFRGPCDQCHGQCGCRSLDSSHRNSHGPVGRGRPHGACLVPGNSHLLCHAPGHWLPAKCHRIQLPVLQGV